MAYRKQGPGHRYIVETEEGNPEATIRPVGETYSAHVDLSSATGAITLGWEQNKLDAVFVYLGRSKAAPGQGRRREYAERPLR